VGGSPARGWYLCAPGWRFVDKDGERGVIINTSSVAGEDGTAGMLGYAATKAALIGMTLPAAREFAGRGIRVNTIVAGGFDTPILDVTGREAAAGQIQFFANPRRLADRRSSQRWQPTSSRTASSTPPLPGSTPATGSLCDRLPWSSGASAHAASDSRGERK
jgi:NAD(P)-dependent dehydrogenase (short-subunit alcohol dehydrogenase family)